jgi:transcription initiation factor TFIIIB Brf1 subunit/transcription initiation factor TFIIB
MACFYIIIHSVDNAYYEHSLFCLMIEGIIRYISNAAGITDVTLRNRFKDLKNQLITELN